ncbi:MAG TPA: HIT family protein [Flavobacteriaceae bacterium]|nr:HIT family protein [Flavobacteriaceae bacterium]MAY53611.1 HIT family protein [Flavobacteriaceae bacterium]HIB46945.1 HIT family protein [Flavobacteriaceae bacterium]HIN99962.1 HIT family protein [Flavobacteriaceae bacterium]
MASIFTKIIEGEIPCHKIAEDHKFIAFLDINPNAKGHTLCVPKDEVDKLFDLGEQDYLQLLQFSRNVAKALERTIPCKRIGLSVIGLEVPHVHVHLIPINDMKDMSFQHKISMDQDEMAALAEDIRKNF